MSTLKLYFAYGSNLNIEQMAYRCPAAKPLKRFIMPDMRLVFRGVADVIEEPGATCPGGLWLITPDCEAALDLYEGIRSGMYRKVEVKLPEPIYGATHVMYYAMNSTGIFPPSFHYLAGIRQGYRDFKLKQKPLNDAVAAAYDDKAPSHRERQRHMRNGRPRLAPRPSC
jgi:hypothetical protein